MTATPEAKAALRAELRARRDMFVLDMAPGERDRHEASVADHVARLVAGAQCVSGYVAIGSELCCLPVLAAAADAGIATALPYITRRGEPMRFLRWRLGDPLEAGPRGLLQPPADAPELAPDLIVTPLLGFDAGLWRIGQGAGFYDASFAAMPRAARIGVAWSVQQAAAIPRDPWDVRLHAVVTELGVLKGAEGA
ncbi:MAG: 5-formyltetrahydrofolate cyclo-ligase [Rhizorhabdus sp.]|nr:5-formyltetrahydrofolate cyclo-ligase [Rhizorhabdus sp.]